MNADTIFNTFNMMKNISTCLVIKKDEYTDMILACKLGRPIYKDESI